MALNPSSSSNRQQLALKPWRG